MVSTIAVPIAQNNPSLVRSLIDVMKYVTLCSSVICVMTFAAFSSADYVDEMLAKKVSAYGDDLNFF